MKDQNEAYELLCRSDLRHESLLLLRADAVGQVLLLQGRLWRDAASEHLLRLCSGRHRVVAGDRGARRQVDQLLVQQVLVETRRPDGQVGGRLERRLLVLLRL